MLCSHLPGARLAALERRAPALAFYTFVANGVGAVLDLLDAHVPHWLGRGVNLEMIPLSYALLNVACVYFEGRGRRAVQVSAAILLGTLPFFLLWCNRPVQFPSLALQDLAIGLECAVTAVILLPGRERSTRAPRLLLGGFLAVFSVLEVGRFAVAFLLKVNPDEFSPRLEVTSAVAYVVATSVLPLAIIWMMNARLEADLLLQVILDPLTLVLNRRGLEQALERELARYRRTGQNLTVAILDLDHFKRLNDAHGHAAGDAVLKEVANLMSKRLRVTDVVGRLGGEEFVLLLPNTDADKSAPVLEYLCGAIREFTFVSFGTTVRVTASFGAATTQGRDPAGGFDLLQEADVALYRAKNNGRDQVRFFAPGEAIGGDSGVTGGVSAATSGMHFAG